MKHIRINSTFKQPNEVGEITADCNRAKSPSFAGADASIYA